jgi:hypothetical protein
MIKVSVNLDLQGKLKSLVDSRRVAKLSELVDKLKEATPVDTGNARDNWKTDGKVIYNEVDYIENLNAGSSRQAPAYFVERTLLAQKGIYPSGTIVRSK